MQDQQNDDLEENQRRKVAEWKAELQVQEEKREQIRNFWELGLMLWVLLGPWTIDLIPWGTESEEGWNFWIGFLLWFAPVFALWALAKRNPF
jgi:hypothetical protein